VTLARGSVQPPTTATSYSGMAWPEMSIAGTEEMHAFAIGDWGGLMGGDMGPGGAAWPVRYAPYTFAIPRPNGCSQADMGACMYVPDQHCNPRCGFVSGVDERAQRLIAEQMDKRAQGRNLGYILNVGDNFYMAGINNSCGTPMHTITEYTKAQFQQIFEDVYSAPSLRGKPWLSVLGNHDYGARQYTFAWDQQVAYTWASDRWTLPAPYFSQRVRYPDQDFVVDIFMLDSNVNDAKNIDAAPGSNICHRRYNGGDSCAATGGPSSPSHCVQWFQDLWHQQAQWLEEKLQASDADWQIAVTHFTCGHNADFYSRMHRSFGLDLLLTGHTHLEEVHYRSGRLGGLTCAITGGGGGITSEASARGHMSRQYGFLDLTLSKETIKLQIINHNGATVSTHTVYPAGTDPNAANQQSQPAPAPSEGSQATTGPSCATYGCGGYRPSLACQCNAQCASHGNCCEDYRQKCAA